MNKNDFYVRYMKYKDKYLNFKNYLLTFNKADLEPVANNFVKQIESSNSPPIYTLTAEKARDVLNDIQKDNKTLIDVPINNVNNF